MYDTVVQFVDYLDPNLYNFLPLLVRKNIINNQYNVKKPVDKYLIISSLDRNAAFLQFNIH